MYFSFAVELYVSTAFNLRLQSVTHDLTVFFSVYVL